MITSRRSFITGLVSFVAAPAIVRVGSIMPVKVVTTEWQLVDFAERMCWPPYGVSPMMQALVDIEQVRKEVARVFAIPPRYLRATR